MKIIFLVTFILALIAKAEYPGARARIQEKLINQGYSHYAEMITNVVAGQVADLKDISITKGSLLFKVTLTFHTLTINKIDFTAANSVQVDLQSDNTVAFTVTNIPFDMRIDYNLKYIFDNDQESLDVRATVSSLKFVVKIVKDDLGCLSFQLTTLTGKVDNFDYDLDAHDILVKAINFLGEWIFKGLIQTAINQSWDQIQSAIQPELDLAADLLKQYYTLTIPNTNFAIDFHVVELSTETDRIDVGLNGTVFNSLKPTHTPPFQPKPLIDFQTNYPISIQLSDYTTNDLLFTLYDLEFLKLDLTPDMMPAESPLKLDTDSLNIYFPGLYETFGSQNVSAHCEINDVPETHFQDTNLTGQFKAFCDFKVNTQDGYVQAFTLSTQISLNLNVSLKTNETGTYVNIYIGGLTFDTIDYSNIHEGLNLDSATSKAQFNILAMFSLQIYNGMNTWISLPIPDFILIEDSSLVFEEGSIEGGVLPKWYIQMLRNAWNA